MSRVVRAGAALCAVVLPLAAAAQARVAHTFELPPICRETPTPPAAAAGTTALTELRTRAEKLIETDPDAAVALLCATIPRVARERGEDSVEMAWWVGSLATPMIAFMDRFDEAAPLLDFAQPIFERRLGPFAAEIADIHVAHAWIANRRGRIPEAVAAWTQALRVRERTPGLRRIELQKALVGLAQSESMLRQFAAARDHLGRAQVILAANGEAVSEAAAAIENTFINIAWREEDFAAVRAHAEAQIRIEEAMGGPAAQRVPAYVWLGQSLERLDEPEQAEAALRRAVEIAEGREGAPLQRHHLVALTELAGLLLKRGKPAEALDFARRSLALGEATRGADAPLLVRPLQYLGEALRATGHLPEALHAYERAADLVARRPDDIERPWVVAHHRGFARVQLELGERVQARASLTAALRAAGPDPTLTVERAATLLALATLSGTSAADEIAESLTLFRARLPESHPAILRALTEACRIELQADPMRTPSCETAAQRLTSPHDLDPFLRHDVHAVSSLLASRRGNAPEARERAIDALSAAAALGTPDPLWRATFALARLLHERDDPALAIFFGKESIAQIEHLRDRFLGEDRGLDRGFIEDKIGVYRSVADWLMAAGRIDEGLEVMRLLKAEEQYEFTLREARPDRMGSGIGLTPEEDALQTRYRDLLGADAATGAEIERLGRLDESGHLSAAERRHLTELLAGQTRTEGARAQRLRAFIAGSGMHSGRGPPGLREARAVQPDPDAALAFFLLTDTHLRVLVATRLGQFEHETPVDATALRMSIGRFLDAIGRRESIDTASRSLFNLLARPLEADARRAGAKRLVLWLDGALRYVPFAALRDERGYLVDRYIIESHAPTGARAIPATGAGTTASHKALSVRGLGLTRGVAGFAPLPAMADELCDVIRGPIEGLETHGRRCRTPRLGDGALDGAGFADAAFTAPRFRTLLSGAPDFSVLHLGTHFSLRPGNARRSFLVLGDGSTLTLDAIREFSFEGLELVTLSACQSGLDGATGGDGREVEGLSSIVQRRGARQVVASLWRVEDRSTARLMHGMYVALSATPGDAASALRRGQIGLRGTRRGLSRPYEHPYYWAGFQVSAAPRADAPRATSE